MVRVLKKYENYSRQGVCDIFDPYSSFTPGAGTWGLQGYVKIPSRENDFVFFVTFGQSQGEHTFDEGVTEDGILTWQSQPRQRLQDKVILQFINHNDIENNIHLFLRTRKGNDYTYLGKLAYISHDIEREQPVYFKWQILDWELTQQRAKEIGLNLEPAELAIFEENSRKLKLTETSLPAPGLRKKGKTTREFRARHIDFVEANIINKNIGLCGELLVIEAEKELLISEGRADLADKIIHISEIQGDGAGYDILSFTPNGELKYIEVKTTTGGDHTAFIMTTNELEFARKNSDNYYLCRVYEYDIKSNTANYYLNRLQQLENFEKEPIQYRVYP